MIKRKLLLTILAICYIGIAFAQDKKIKVTGDVTDYETAEPIIVEVSDKELMKEIEREEKKKGTGVTKSNLKKKEDDIRAAFWGLK